jgi:hypothetical protein
MKSLAASRLRRCLSSIGLAVVAACGGGGGGSDEPAADSTAITLSNFRFAGTELEFFQGRDSAQQLSITANASGDLDSLSGRTVYVFVEDPDQLFDVASGSLTMQSNGQVDLSISSRAELNTVGTFRGPMRVSACLDAACRQPLGGSPIVVPYTINVLPGLALAQSAPPLSIVAFGERLPSWSSAVMLPSGATDFGLQLRAVSGQGDGTNLVELTRLAGSINLSGRRAPVGDFAVELEVQATGVTSSGAQRTQSIARTFQYRVTGPAQLTVLYEPSTVTFTAPAGQTQQTATTDVTSLASNGSVYYRPRFEYQPPGAGGNLDAQGIAWLRVSSFGVAAYEGRVGLYATACESDINGTRCLPPGRYDALVHLATDRDQDAPTPLRVSLTVSP